MPLPCQSQLDAAADLLDFGVVTEAAGELTRLHRCARDAGCTDWQACNRQVEGLWQPAAGSAAPRPARPSPLG